MADACFSRSFKSFEELVADYESGELHPADLKPALSKALNKILEVRLVPFRFTQCFLVMPLLALCEIDDIDFCKPKLYCCYARYNCLIISHYNCMSPVHQVLLLS